ncbi:hypothetical protein HG531_002299 [Fusarium graminearum]|nr:hypothetical protein HG531_002299 [Fusarium graminearum]
MRVSSSRKDDTLTMTGLDQSSHVRNVVNTISVRIAMLGWGKGCGSWQLVLVKAVTAKATAARFSRYSDRFSLTGKIRCINCQIGSFCNADIGRNAIASGEKNKIAGNQL